MPMQVSADRLGLPDPIVRAAVPQLLFAETANLLGVTVLIVNRSLIVKDTDPIYKDVAALLGRCHPELIWETQFPDPAMWFGQHRVLVYLLHETPAKVIPTDPRVVRVLDILTSWGKPCMPAQVGEEYHNRLLEAELAEMV